MCCCQCVVFCKRGDKEQQHLKADDLDIRSLPLPGKILKHQIQIVDKYLGGDYNYLGTARNGYQESF